ncbi:MAG: LysM peptidoglycan-binding domain-containing protein [Candidatus Schekmanbacteria bacterium]|nr:LysM peptidoglycan-binding domain-containing protein [Candidatus Schekmanbacteria bacterium]
MINNARTGNRPRPAAAALILLTGALVAAGASCATIEKTVQEHRKSVALDRLREGRIEDGTYLNGYYQIRVTSPASWTAKQFKEDALVTFVAPDEITVIDVVAEALEDPSATAETPRAEPAAPPASAQELEALVRSRLSQDQSITSRRPLLVDGRPGLELFIEGQWGKDATRGRIIATVDHGRLFFIRSVTVAPLFDKNLESFDAVIRSFTFTADNAAVGPGGLAGADHFTYQVQPGESLEEVARRFLGDPKRAWILAHYNDIREAQPWAYIVVPRYVKHILRQGQTARAISKHYYGSPDESKRILEYSNLEAAKIGDELYVPLYSNYDVKAGDTLEALGEQYFFDAKKGAQIISDYNRLAGYIFPGQRLKIPFRMLVPRDAPAVEHIVSARETLATIALDLTGDLENWKAVASFNELSPPFIVVEGQVLRIPRQLLKGYQSQEASPEATPPPTTDKRRRKPEPDRQQAPRPKPTATPTDGPIYEP